MTSETAKVSLRDRNIGEIAAALPGATAVFRKFKLDFCCGGDLTLGEVASKRGLDIASIEGALAALDPNAGLTVPEETGPLIDHILSRYHETHRRELPELIRLARKVEAVHAVHPQAPIGLADTLHEMHSELEVHMQKEEMELFPLMRRDGDPLDALSIEQMRDDHHRHGDHLRRLEEIANGFVPPEGACRSWQALCAGGAKLVDDVMEHIHLENNVLFPRFGQPESAGHAYPAGSTTAVQPDAQR
ncbi:iron-sulfur cluster repair di-iron protein [Chelativorans sp. AA-79]|uniref:iron-sulfur cluster repair di-iron protein n=1 Tax=Chelativorans sp. AA-79 TaxID=3028735 RepID=UPI0023F7C1E1|nr:iron-sulfur cluster repair di-iron protein [Chelativorans sp. AA-79]WEX08590.1 iron-sulfur cluster repair di-iron protein [Chelativorans sp. AA-79]